MSNLDDAIAENTAFDLLEIRQAKRAKVKQREGWGGNKPPATQPKLSKVFKVVRTTTWGNGNEK